MIARKIVDIVAVTELLIGGITIIGILSTALLSISHKPLNVFLFVLVASSASTAIGIGLFKRHHWAWVLLVFFSGYIVITKIMVMAQLLIFTGEIITAIPTELKNYISIAYHSFIVVYFTRKGVRSQFVIP